MSSGWKNWVMFCTSPTRCLGALRYQAVLKALAVALLTIRFGKTSGMVPSDGAAKCSGSRAQLGRQVGEPGLVAPGEHRPAHVLAPGHGVEPGDRVGVVLVAVGHLAASGRRGRCSSVGVDQRSRRSRPAAGRWSRSAPRRSGPSRRWWPRTAARLPVRGERAHLAVGHQQVEGAYVVAETALGVVVLAVHVGGDGAADGDLPGAGQDRAPRARRAAAPASAHRG